MRHALPPSSSMYTLLNMAEANSTSRPGDPAFGALAVRAIEVLVTHNEPVSRDDLACAPGISGARVSQPCDPVERFLEPSAARGKAQDRTDAPASPARVPNATGRDTARRLTGCVRSSAWIWLFSSAHNTRARSGGFRYKPTMSRTFSINCGSVDWSRVSCAPRHQSPRSCDGCTGEWCSTVCLAGSLLG